MLKKNVWIGAAATAAFLLCARGEAAPKQADVLGGILEVSMKLDTTAPSEVTVRFPAINSLGVKARSQKLTRVSGSGTWGIYRTEVSPSPYLRFVNHPDQWDVMQLKAKSPTRSFVIEHLRVTYQMKHEDGTPGGTPSNYHNFVRTINAPPYNGTWSAPWMKGHPDDFQFGGSINVKGSFRGWTVSLKNRIRDRREEIAERVIQATGAPYTRFEDLPRSVQEAVYDIGQSGTTKLANGNGGHCSITQAYYQCVFSDYFSVDFPAMCACDLTKCWAVNTPWPYPSGTFQKWTDEVIEDRQLGRVNFTQANDGKGAKIRTGINSTFPVQSVEPRSGTWSVTGYYTPKAGDMFWRMENCWHAGQNPPAGHTGPIPHAMTLVGPLRSYSDASGFRLEAAIFDGSSMINVYDFIELNDWLNERIYVDGFDTTARDDLDGDGCIEPDEVDPVRYANYDHERSVYKKYCRYCGKGNNSCANVELFCAKTDGWYYRRDYFVGESISQ